jgi:anti-sigma B factor antagonist
MAQPTAFEMTDVQGVHVVKFRDSSILDANQIDKISQQLYALHEQNQGRKVILDFASVRLLSSQMLGVLVTFNKKVTQARGALMLAGLKSDLARVFKITSLDKLFKFADSRDAALKAYGVKVEKKEDEDDE